MTEQEIRQRLEEMSRSFAPDVTNLAKVKSVNEKNCTCVLIDDDGQEFFDVRLKPITGKNRSFLQVPKKDSFVLAVRIESSEEWMVVACSEIERIQVIINNINMSDLINDLFSAIGRMTFSNTAGPTGTTLNLAEFQALQQRFNSIIF